MARAQLIQTPEEHHWVLLDHRVIELAVGTEAVALHTWALDASAELRIGGAFTLVLPGGAARSLDPVQSETLAPALALVRRYLRSLTIARTGELRAQLSDGYELAVTPDPRYEAWVLQGAGALEGVAYRCPPGGGVPWA